MLTRLAAIPGLHIAQNVPLAQHTRFALGGPARLLADAATGAALMAGIETARRAEYPLAIIGGGTNLVPNDDGFPGLVLRYTASRIRNEPKAAASKLRNEPKFVQVDSGAILQD